MSDVSVHIEGAMPKGEPLELIFETINLYHGTNVPNIEVFNKAEDTTVGEGIYFTSKIEDATGYAIRRAKNRGGSPLVYEVACDNLKLANLTTKPNIDQVLIGLLPILEEQIKAVKENDWGRQNVLQNAIVAIKAGSVKPGGIKDIAYAIGDTFSSYIESLGFDGLKTTEGGEGEDVGNHDTYLIFDPEKVRIENKINL